MTDQPNPTPEPEPEPQSQPELEPRPQPQLQFQTEPTATEDFWAPAEAPTTAAPTTSEPAAAATATAASAVTRHRPLFGTIFWGVILLAFAAFMVVWTLQPGSPDPTLWLLGGVIVVGLLLVVAGIAAASRRAG
jgi:outer membrane biosynthesis protein TonB